MYSDVNTHAICCFTGHRNILPDDAAGLHARLDHVISALTRWRHLSFSRKKAKGRTSHSSFFCLAGIRAARGMISIRRSTLTFCQRQTAYIIQRNIISRGACSNAIAKWWTDLRIAWRTVKRTAAARRTPWITPRKRACVHSISAKSVDTIINRRIQLRLRYVASLRSNRCILLFLS